MDLYSSLLRSSGSYWLLENLLRTTNSGEENNNTTVKNANKVSCDSSEISKSAYDKTLWKVPSSEALLKELNLQANIMGASSMRNSSHSNQEQAENYQYNWNEVDWGLIGLNALQPEMQQQQMMLGTDATNVTEHSAFSNLKNGINLGPAIEAISHRMNPAGQQLNENQFFSNEYQINDVQQQQQMLTLLQQQRQMERVNFPYKQAADKIGVENNIFHPYSFADNSMSENRSNSTQYNPNEIHNNGVDLSNERQIDDSAIINPMENKTLRQGECASIEGEEPDTSNSYSRRLRTTRKRKRIRYVDSEESEWSPQKNSNSDSDYSDETMSTRGHKQSNQLFKRHSQSRKKGAASLTNQLLVHEPSIQPVPQKPSKSALTDGKKQNVEKDLTSRILQNGGMPSTVPRDLAIQRNMYGDQSDACKYLDRRDEISTVAIEPPETSSERLESLSLRDYDMCEVTVEWHSPQLMETPERPPDVVPVRRVFGINAGMTLFNLHRIICISLGIEDEQRMSEFSHVWILPNNHTYGGGPLTRPRGSGPSCLRVTTDRGIEFRHAVSCYLDPEGRIIPKADSVLIYVLGCVQLQVQISAVLRNQTKQNALIWVPRCIMRGTYGTAPPDGTNWNSPDDICRHLPEFDVAIHAINMMFIETRFSKNTSTSRRTKMIRAEGIDQSVLECYSEGIHEFWSDPMRVRFLSIRVSRQATSNNRRKPIEAGPTQCCLPSNRNATAEIQDRSPPTSTENEYLQLAQRTNVSPKNRELACLNSAVASSDTTAASLNSGSTSSTRNMLIDHHNSMHHLISDEYLQKYANESIKITENKTNGQTNFIPFGTVPSAQWGFMNPNSEFQPNSIQFAIQQPQILQHNLEKLHANNLLTNPINAQEQMLQILAQRSGYQNEMQRIQHPGFTNTINTSEKNPMQLALATSPNIHAGSLELRNSQITTNSHLQPLQVISNTNNQGGQRQANTQAFNISLASASHRIRGVLPTPVDIEKNMANYISTNPVSEALMDLNGDSVWMRMNTSSNTTCWNKNSNSKITNIPYNIQSMPFNRTQQTDIPIAQNRSTDESIGWNESIYLRNDNTNIMPEIGKEIKSTDCWNFQNIMQHQQNPYKIINEPDPLILGALHGVHGTRLTC